MRVTRKNVDINASVFGLSQLKGEGAVRIEFFRMKAFVLIGGVSALATGALVPQTAGAAQITVEARGNGCSLTSGGSTAQSVDCGTATASAGFGRLSVLASSAGVRGMDGRLSSSGSGYATAFFSDRLFFGVDSGTFTIPLDFDGTLIARIIGSGGAKAQLSASGGVGGSEGERFSASLTSIVGLDGSITTTTSGTESEVRNATFAFDGGELLLSGGMRADATCLDVGQNTSCSAESNYSSSLRLLGGILRDLDGNILNGVSVTSDSGHDYLEGVEPHVRTVPLPSTALLFATGLLGLFGLRRFQSA